MVDSTGRRLHSMDALRAIAMLLGIVLHLEMAYMANVWPVWPIDDESSNVLFDISFYFIHSCRMQVFFLMAGFFACMLHARYGTWRSVTHRAKRILLPLLAGVLTIVPLCKLCWGYGFNQMMPAPVTTAEVVRAIAEEPWIPGLNLFHLWFLWYLLIMYTVAWLWLGVARRITLMARLNAAAVAGMAWIVRHRLTAIALGIASLPLLFLQTQGLGPDTDSLVFPTAFRIVAYYMVYFTAGWLIYRRIDLLPRLADWWPAQLSVGLGFLFPLWMVLGGSIAAAPDGPAPLLLLAGRATAALLAGFLVVGFTGLFLRCFDRPNPVMRYISDSAYWLYLAHLPLVLMINFLLEPLALGAVAKFALGLGLATALLLGSYQLCVRHTPIGTMLNGPRRRRSAVAAAPEPLPT